MKIIFLDFDGVMDTARYDSSCEFRGDQALMLMGRSSTLNASGT